mmetsp:Transcript_50313/g.109044  ORF Transcript_50313/g.109044 Transcript_50313/m.109044 type:complete len:254 (-) Transcript_50313:827-1588(-)|eukprot:6209038-Pleurochrysis_carterae.AAC.9
MTATQRSHCYGYMWRTRTKRFQETHFRMLACMHAMKRQQVPACAAYACSPGVHWGMLAIEHFIQHVSEGEDMPNGALAVRDPHTVDLELVQRCHHVFERLLGRECNEERRVVCVAPLVHLLRELEGIERVQRFGEIVLVHDVAYISCGDGAEKLLRLVVGDDRNGGDLLGRHELEGLDGELVLPDGDEVLAVLDDHGRPVAQRDEGVALHDSMELRNGAIERGLVKLWEVVVECIDHIGLGDQAADLLVVVVE